MLRDLDIGFALRAPDPLSTKDLDLGFAVRGEPAPSLSDFDLDFALAFDENQSLAIVKVGDALTAAPLLMLVAGALVDPVNGAEWSP